MTLNVRRYEDGSVVREVATPIPAHRHVAPAPVIEVVNGRHEKVVLLATAGVVGALLFGLVLGGALVWILR